MVIIEIWVRESAVSHLDVLCLVVLRYIFLILCFCILLIYLFVLCAFVHTHVPWCLCGDQIMTFGSQVSPPTMSVQGMELRSSGLWSKHLY